MIKRPLRIADRNIPVRTQAEELIIFPKFYKRLGLQFGDIIKIPKTNIFPKKWWGEKAIVVERYKSVNKKPNGNIRYNRGAEVIFLTGGTGKIGKVRRFCNKLTINSRVEAEVV